MKRDALLALLALSLIAFPSGCSSSKGLSFPVANDSGLRGSPPVGTNEPVVELQRPVEPQHLVEPRVVEPQRPVEPPVVEPPVVEPPVVEPQRPVDAQVIEPQQVVEPRRLVEPPAVDSGVPNPTTELRPEDILGDWWAASYQYWWHFYPDGTFDSDRGGKGVWKIQDKQIIATATNQGNNPSTWIFLLSADGKTMSATWSDPQGAHGAVSLIRI